MGRTLSIALLAFAACAPPQTRTVPRVVDGHVEEGPLVGPYAYEWFIEGEKAAAQGRHEDAALAFESATAAPARDVFLMARLAEEYEMSGSTRRAERALAAARRDNPRSARVALAEARIRQHRGEERDAMRAFIEARTLDPTWEEAVIALAEALDQRGLTMRANAILIQYIDTHRGNHAQDARRALVRLSRRNSDPESLRRALVLGPEGEGAREALAAAKLAYDTGQPALATRLLEGTTGTPANRNLWLQATIRSGDPDAARDFLSGAPSDAVGGPIRHADLLSDLGAHDQALEILQAAGRSPRAQVVRGRSLLDRGDYVSAARALARIPEGSSVYEEARLALASSLAAKRRSGAASETLSLAPHDSLAARRELAEFFVSQGDLRRALRLFDPKRPADRAVLASIFEHAGRYSEASAYYASIQAGGSEEPRVRARAAAERLAASGQFQSAIYILERRANAAPTDLFARVRLVELSLSAERPTEAEAHGRAVLPVIEDTNLRAHLASLLTKIEGGE